MEEQTSKLRQAITRTVAWCDVLEIPPTVTEIWRWLMQYEGEQPRLFDVERLIVEDPWLRDRIEHTTAYVTLKGRGELWDKREWRRVWALRKWKRALRAAKLVRCVPFVRLIAVTNTLAWDGTDEESDIDFFIVTRAGRLWTTRILVMLLLHVVGWRRHGNKIKNRICLGFWVDETELNLEPLALKPDDPYFAFWLITMWPVYGQTTYRRLQDANNWRQKIFPFCPLIEPTHWRSVSETGLWRFIPKVDEFFLGGWLGDLVERLLRTLQMRRIYQHKNSAIHERGTSVVATPNIAKFHEQDRRINLLERWQQIILRES